MISDELLEYAARHTTPELPILEKLNHETHLSQVSPQMIAGSMQGTFLRYVSEMMKPLHVLEIGTFTGYSAICLASGMPSTGVLHTIEVNPEQEEIIRRYIWEAGMEKQICLHIGEAKSIIPTLSETWDLVYIDADKPNYLDYYHLVFDKLRSSGFILADNALWNGKVLNDRTKPDKDTLGIIQFNEFVQQDDRVDNLLLPFRDGMMMVQKR
jgi:predicted O-methyltransferase YrrM